MYTGQRAIKLAWLANDDDVMMLDWVIYWFYIVPKKKILVLQFTVRVVLPVLYFL